MPEPRIRQAAARWLAGVAFVVSAYAVWTLISLRLQTGEDYPAYSSLRADPIGTKALFESLELLGSVEVSRSFTSRPRVHRAPDTALLVLGLYAQDPIDKRLVELADEGARVVLALLPTSKVDWWRRMQQKSRAPGNPGFTVPETTVRIESLGLAFARADRDPSLEATLGGSYDLPGALDWHGASTFTSLDPAWRTVYKLGDEPVLIEKDQGKGTIVLMADGYFLSNEALRDDRKSTLIAWLLGSKPSVVFEEAHLGVGGDPGVVSLVRTLGLEGVAVSVLALACLFVWRSSARFLPPAERPSGNGSWVRGRDSQEAFVSLLRRAAGEDDLIKTCLEEWRRTPSASARVSPERSRALEAELVDHLGRHPRQRDSLQTYRNMVRILTEREWKKPSNS